MSHWAGSSGWSGWEESRSWGGWSPQDWSAEEWGGWSPQEWSAEEWGGWSPQEWQARTSWEGGGAPRAAWHPCVTPPLEVEGNLALWNSAKQKAVQTLTGCQISLRCRKQYTTSGKKVVVAGPDLGAMKQALDMFVSQVEGRLVTPWPEEPTALVPKPPSAPPPKGSGAASSGSGGASSDLQPHPPLSPPPSHKRRGLSRHLSETSSIATTPKKKARTPAEEGPPLPYLVAGPEGVQEAEEAPAPAEAMDRPGAVLAMARPGPHHHIWHFHTFGVKALGLPAKFAQFSSQLRELHPDWFHAKPGEVFWFDLRMVKQRFSQRVEDGRNHLGSHLYMMRSMAKQELISGYLSHLKDSYNMVCNIPGPLHIDCFFFCNWGCHRSVALCTLVQHLFHRFFQEDVRTHHHSRDKWPEHEICDQCGVYTEAKAEVLRNFLERWVATEAP